MAGSKEIKNRIKSVKNTKKITKAMELVAASKMKRAVASTLASRTYAGYSWEILTSVAKNIEEYQHPLFTKKTVEKDTPERILLVLVTSNRGLCGAYNAQIIKKTLHMLRSVESTTTQTTEIDIVAIGKKGDLAMRRIGKNVIASFNNFPDNITLLDTLPVSKLATEEYSAGNYHKVFVAYTDFVSVLTQKSKIRQLLPVAQSELKELIDELSEEDEEKVGEDEASGNGKIDYLFEGNMDKLISSLAQKITQMQIYQMLLESNASEQSARMMAMKNASDASGEMIEDLTLVFNKARQANITREISEISAGMASVE